MQNPRPASNGWPAPETGNWAPLSLSSTFFFSPIGFTVSLFSFFLTHIHICFYPIASLMQSSEIHKNHLQFLIEILNISKYMECTLGREERKIKEDKNYNIIRRNTNLNEEFVQRNSFIDVILIGNYEPYTFKC